MVNLRTLINRLNDETRAAMDAAAGFCMSRTHYDVEIEHYLMKLLDRDDGDIPLILKHFGIDRARLASQVTERLDRMKTGSGDRPSLSPRLLQMLEEAWLLGSLELDEYRIRTGHTLLALVADEELRRRVTANIAALEKIPGEELRQGFHAIVEKSVEGETAAARPEAADGGPAPKKTGGKTAHLDKYTFDLTEQARQGELDPVLGRDFEIRQCVDILTRRRQNNPILVGEAGVGKTAVVEGFAMRIARGDVPPVLRNVSLRSLDLALLQAGAGVKGEFENRLKGLINEVKSSPTPIVLFIDEAHTMIGAGGAAGQNDAANLLKPALARGELRTVAATTWSEYKKYFEKDPALTRRFQLVKVEEPTEEVCSVMMRGVVPTLEKHHKVRILDDGMDAAVRLSARYISDRNLPDKAVSVLDTACARLSLGQTATPPSIERAHRRLQDLDVQDRVLTREQALGIDHQEELALIAEEREKVRKEMERLDERWKKEQDLVDEIRELQQKLEATIEGPSGNGTGPAEGAVAGNGAAASEGAVASDSAASSEGAAEDDETSGEAAGDAGTAPAAVTAAAGGGATATAEAGAATAEAATQAADVGTAGAVDPDQLRADLRRLDAQLREIQGEDPLVPVSVNGDLVSQVISGWTGIPVGKMMRDDVATALELETHLGKRIIGQDHALQVVSHRIRTSKAGIEDPKKPVGVFLFVGPSGVGKTETALALSDLLYGGERNLISINMSEFQEAHTVSSLKGSPPGYVGYGEGGVLTEAVRRRPYSVVLLDEVEKAHPDVMELFFQVFDKGTMEDGEGREIDFKNNIIVLTSNVATDTIMELSADPETRPEPAGLVDAIKPEMNKVFQPALLGRTVIVPYYPLRDEALKEIIGLKLRSVRNRLFDTHRVELTHSDALVSEIAARCTEVESGARNIDNILTNTVLPDLSTILLQAMVEGEEPDTVHLDVGEDGVFTYNGRSPAPAGATA